MARAQRAMSCVITMFYAGDVCRAARMLRRYDAAARAAMRERRCFAA